MALNSNSAVVLKIYSADQTLLIAKPFPDAEAAEAWATGYIVEANKTTAAETAAAVRGPITFEIAAMPPRI